MQDLCISSLDPPFPRMRDLLYKVRRTVGAVIDRTYSASSEASGRVRIFFRRHVTNGRYGASYL